MDEIVIAECSDDEEYDKSGYKLNNTWCPNLDEVEALYQRMTNEKLIEFQWRCPGRRNPNEESKAMVEIEKPVVETINVSGAYDFDFEDDGPLPQKLPSKASTPKGLAKKKTTTLAIMANMEKHRIMDKLATDETNTTK